MRLISSPNPDKEIIIKELASEIYGTLKNICAESVKAMIKSDIKPDLTPSIIISASSMLLTDLFHDLFNSPMPTQCLDEALEDIADHLLAHRGRNCNVCENEEGPEASPPVGRPV